MAKAKAMAQENTVEIAPAPQDEPLFIMWGDAKHYVSDLPAHAVSYLIKHGAKQSFGEAVAGLRKKLEGEGKDEATIVAELAKAQAEKWEKVYNGTIAVREGVTRLSSEEKTKNDIAKAMILANAAEKGKKAPTAETLEAYISAVRVKYAEKIQAEYDRRKSAFSLDEDLLA